MANKPIRIDMNVVKEVGKGIKLLFVEKDLEVNVKKGRVLCSLDMNANYGETKDAKKHYLGVVNRQMLELNGDTYSINFYILKHDNPTIKPEKDIKEKYMNEM